MCREGIRTFVERAAEMVCDRLTYRHGAARERCGKALIVLAATLAVAISLFIATLHAIELFGHERVGRVVLIAVFATGFFVHRRSLAKALHFLAVGVTGPLPYFLIVFPAMLFALSQVLPADAVMRYLALPVLLAHATSIACAYRSNRPYKSFMDRFVGDLKENPAAFAAALAALAALLSLAALAALVPNAGPLLALALVAATALGVVALATGMLSPKLGFAHVMMSSLLRAAGLIAYFVISLVVVLATSYFAGAVGDLRAFEAVGAVLLLSLLYVANALEEEGGGAGRPPRKPVTAAGRRKAVTPDLGEVGDPSA